MKRAIVLSGGGSKGAYQLGFWKAIRKLGIKYDIVTGTSIGALNGAMMVQNDYKKDFNLWYFMNYEMALDKGLDDSYYDPKGRKKVVLKYVKGALKGGIEASGLKKTLDDNIDLDKFYKSNIDYGLVTVKFPSLKPVLITKDNIPKEKLCDYLLASASCFPAFKVKNIDNKPYIDGGYYDNMPINLAIKMGADEVIAVDLKAIGNLKKVKNKDIPITTISPKNNIGNFLALESVQTRNAIKFGYNDTMKMFKKLEGDIYTFKKKSLNRNYVRLYDSFLNNLNIYAANSLSKPKYKRLIGKSSEMYFNKTLENLAKSFSLDETKIYRTSVMNQIIKKEYLKDEYKSFNNIKKIIKNNKLKNLNFNKELICYILNEILNQEKQGRLLTNLATLFPDSYICALYLKTILRK